MKILVRGRLRRRKSETAAGNRCVRWGFPAFHGGNPDPA